MDRITSKPSAPDHDTLADATADGDGTDPRDAPYVERAQARGAAGDVAGTIAALDDGIAAIADRTPEAGRRIRGLLATKAGVLRQARAFDASIAVWDAIITDLATAEEPLADRSLAIAMLEKAMVLAAALRAREAAEAFSALIDRFSTATDPEIRGLLGSALYNRAATLRDAGRVDEAIAAYQATVVMLHDDATGPGSRWVALALYNHAGLLDELGRADEAHRLRELVADRFRSAPEAMARERAAWAARQLVDGALELGRSDEALAGLQAIVDAFADDPATELRVAAAEAAVDAGIVLLQDGRRDEAAAAFERARLRFGADPDDEVRALVEDIEGRLGPVRRTPHLFDNEAYAAQGLRLRDEALVSGFMAAVTVAAGVVIAALVLLLLPTTLEVRAAVTIAILVVAAFLARRLARRGRAALANLEVYLEQRRDEDAAQRQLHERATAIVDDFRETGRPFALYLRGFELEGSLHAARLPDGTTISSQQPRPPVIERRLAEALEGRVPVLGIFNPAETWSRMTNVIPRFSLPNDGWREVLVELIEGADLIVMQPVSLTTGVALELTRIGDHARRDDAVIILPGAETLSEIGVRQGVLRVLGGEVRVAEPIDRAHPALRWFTRVVNEDDLPPDLATSAVFAELLERIADLTARDPTERRAARNARITEDEGERLAMAGDFARAIQRLTTARAEQERLDDRLGLLATLRTIGSVQLAAGDLEAARQTLEHASSLCRPTDVHVRGQILLALGLVHREAGRSVEAAAAFGDAVGLLEQVGTAADRITALHGLAEARLVNGDPDGHVEALEAALELHRAGHETDATGGTLSQLGVGLALAGRDTEARSILEEALPLVRQAGDRHAERVTLAYLARSSAALGQADDVGRFVAQARAVPGGEDDPDLLAALDTFDVGDANGDPTALPAASPRVPRRRVTG